jgi:hypothetical protein
MQISTWVGSPKYIVFPAFMKDFGGFFGRTNPSGKLANICISNSIQLRHQLFDDVSGG